MNRNLFVIFQISLYELKCSINRLFRQSKLKEKVYEILTWIPQGKVVTYGQIAECLGDKRLSRVVGNVLHQNPDESKYPCYKVVNCKGALSESYAFGGIEAQKRKLESEGIQVVNNKVNCHEYQLSDDEMKIIINKMKI